MAARAVGAYIGAAYWFTSSTSFANPAVTIGRMFSDTLPASRRASLGGFIGMQLIGAAVAVVLMLVLYPDVSAVAAEVVVPAPWLILLIEGFVYALGNDRRQRCWDLRMRLRLHTMATSSAGSFADH